MAKGKDKDAQAAQANAPAHGQLLESEVPAAKEAFLVALATCGTITHAARAAGCGRRTVYDWLDSDPDFAEAFAIAREDGTDELVREARRRAVEGEPVIRYNALGEVVSETRVYSDPLLLALLKAGRPSEFGDRREVTLGGQLGVKHSGGVDVFARLADYEAVLGADEGAEGGTAGSNGAGESVAGTLPGTAG